MSTGPDDPEFADPSAVHPLLSARTRWPERDLPPPPRLPVWTAPDHRMAHVAIAMGALLLCVSAWTNGLLILSDLAATLPPRFDERGGVLYDDAQIAETLRLLPCSMWAHGATLVFLVLASITGGRGHRTASLLLFWPVFLGVLLAMASGMNALEYFGR
ncbi:hypothetical protein [Clavibacter michiganensis]|uniref:Uncharacterized protein n=1 Tax=Clavibacter michiganensis subsp. insidiosus TaxID=33014 RepID=A0A0D5CKD9_9MICO|nr:hypothetical protein [Clavibacter michiganensis]AJW80126.1 hypothetical protein VO01_14245 [Clavibacter michiganensis subsp. insidiosus]AWF97213.1 hypothetical protein BEH61_01705 [Clavibacter michiganensis subsp. insidiosus]AWG02700.1 hypothetical protein BEH62_13970 [Clavibacter michiganensis subsp. insidiosus]OQJ58878.1 hypothetical protein B5P21_02410 [Clavibacter michiganensis subsp. insidiosus]RII85124.1 hypothetical protein DZF92_15435 [Clavibacter michiganensis subsp. insidiosus]